jgi:uncharacterized protein (TIGR03437 family)
MALAAVCCFCASAQYTGLATPFDGSVVYFASALTLKNTNEPIWGKLFVADGSGVRLIRALPQIDPSPPGYTSPTCIIGNFYDFLSVQASADGAILSSRGYRATAGTCYRYITQGTYLVSAAGDSQLSAPIFISPDGRHAISDTRLGQLSAANLEYVDVATGNFTQIHLTVVDLFGAYFGTGRVIANNGTAIFMLGSEQGYVVRPGSDPQPFPIPNTYLWAIDADGVNVLYTTWVTVPIQGGFGQLRGSMRLYNLETGQDTLVLQDASSGLPYWMSDDAQRVLFVEPTAVSIIDEGNPRLRQLITDASGIRAATLSGNGKVAYVGTLSGRLLKINVDTGDTVELIGRTPNITETNLNYLPFLPGFPGTIYLNGLPDIALGSPTPPELSLADTTVTVDGIPAPVLFVMPDHIDFLVPWNVVIPGVNVQDQQKTIVVGVNGVNTPFAFPASQIWVSNRSEFTSVIHQDWSAPVSDNNPAHAGEILHLYAIGLGAVTPAVQPGAPAPSAEPLARLTTPLQCTASTVLYAGLAPGATWRTYQVDLQLPRQSGKTRIACSIDGGKSALLSLSLTVAP